MGEFALPLVVLQQRLFGLLEFSRIDAHFFKDNAADGLLRGPAVNPLGALIPIKNPVFQVAYDDGITGQVQHPRLLRDFILGQLAVR